ncbi:MAG: hypothetical protein IK019_01690, partial [Clostridia bacterium]|nr:hypothetical protein [Clostridia bacterium]
PVPMFAAADEVLLNGNSAFTMDVASFSQQFNTLAASMNYPFEWSSEPNTESGYNRYIGLSSDDLCTVIIHENTNGMFAFQASIDLDLNNQSDKAMTAGEDLGAAMVCAGLTLYQSEFGDLSYDVINKVEEETQDLMTPLYSLGGLTEEQLENGIAHVGTMCGFPAGTEVSSYTIDGITYLYVGFFVCPMEWELTVE